MRRRDILAGVGSLGTIGGAGALAIRGPPSFGDGTDETQSGNSDGTGSPDTEPLTIETIDAPGSEAGEVRVPASDRPTFIDFFGTWCPPCIEQMPALAVANDRIGDDVLFISITSEAIGRSVTKAELVDWWEKHDGNWSLGLDPTAELTARYLLRAAIPLPSRSIRPDAFSGRTPASKRRTNSWRGSNRRSRRGRTRDRRIAPVDGRLCAHCRRRDLL